MLGIIQEQNPDRCRLFMQWRQMTWPILVDTFDFLEVSLVPLTYAIDEHGIVRHAGLRLSDAETLEERFVAKTYAAPEPVSARSEAQSGETWRRFAGRAALGDDDAIDRTLDALRQRVEQAPDDGWAHFRLAAAYRLRYDSGSRQDQDFGRAVDHWQRALEIDPNNYIWRRRIQQYGPRLAKPYPFYDWVAEARADIRARGEEPVALVAEPSGSEIAQPTRSLAVQGAPAVEPDPDGRVFRDPLEPKEPRYVDAEVTTIPNRVQAGAAVRGHFVFRPNEARLAHWNNESEPLRVWIDAPPTWRLDRTLLTGENAEAATSTEDRRLEVEIEVPKGTMPGSYMVPAYALYYVCEDIDGICLYRRQDLHVALTVVE